MREIMEQIKWERDVAIEQLKELGYGLGEKIRTDEDCISREYILSKAHCCCDELADDGPCCVDVDDIKKAPSIQLMRLKGEWLKDEYGVHCSNCQSGLCFEYKFCPWCGADMRGE